MLKKSFFVDNGVVRTEFYRLIELGVGEAADDLVDAFMAKVEEDGITDMIKERLIGVVSNFTLLNGKKAAISIQPPRPRIRHPSRWQAKQAVMGVHAKRA